MQTFSPGIADANECSLGTHACTCGGLAGCTALCTDTAGSYTCGCSAGYVLNTDGVTCVGELPALKSAV